MLSEQRELLIHSFILHAGAADTGTVCFHGRALRPVKRVGVAAGPVKRVLERQQGP